MGRLCPGWGCFGLGLGGSPGGQFPGTDGRVLAASTPSGRGQGERVWCLRGPGGTPQATTQDYCGHGGPASQDLYPLARSPQVLPCCPLDSCPQDPSSCPFQPLPAHHPAGPHRRGWPSVSQPPPRGGQPSLLCPWVVSAHASRTWPRGGGASGAPARCSVCTQGVRPSHP